jgi:hypothetical protein
MECGADEGTGDPCISDFILLGVGSFIKNDFVSEMLLIN